MPTVPEFNKQVLKPIYNPKDSHKPASYKQKNYIITLCKRHKIDAPDLSRITKGEAAQLLSNMINVNKG